MIYLDNAATTLRKPPTVAAAMLEALRYGGGAGRGGHRAAMYAAERLLDCREEAAALFGIDDPERVIFTGNATHALNIAIRGLVKGPGRVIVSGYEHNAVMRPLKALEAGGVAAEHLKDALFEPEMALHQLEVALERPTVAVIINHVSNVFGYVQPLARMGQLCAERGVPFIADVSQSAGCLPIDAGALPDAAFCMPGHKGLYGPQGTGILIAPRGAMLSPFLMGGTGSLSAEMEMPDFLPDRLEAGTHNLPGVAGLLEGIRFVRRRGVEAIFAHEKELLRLAVSELSRLRGLRLYYADHFFCQTGVLSMTSPDLEPEAIAQSLGEDGIAVRAGLQCAPLAHRSAGTFPDGTVRVSFSAFNTRRDVQMLASSLRRILPRR